MRLSNLLFKPKWQDKDAAVRRVAVATAGDAELVAALPELVRADPDAGVRLVALKRLNNYEYWRERSTGDSDDALRRAARAAYLSLLCANAAGAPPLPRQIAELDTLSVEEIDKVATTAVLRDLRASALAYVNRPGLLAERAIADPDPQLRLQLLERIDDPGLLERIAERARKIDKAVNRRARERLEALRISAGDAATIADKARSLCERVEALMRTPNAMIEAELAGIDADWTALGNALPVELSARYRGAHSVALRAHEMLQNPQLSSAHDAPEPMDSEPLPSAPVDAPATLAVAQALASQARFDAALAAVQVEAKIERERQQSQQREAEALLPQFAAVIDAGDSANAHRLHRQIHDLLKTSADASAPLQRQLVPLEARYAEMKRWQHWSNSQRRRALCADIETLASSGLHPDAVATRVREAREEWQRMDSSEGIDADATADGIARRFHAACHRALRPTQAYFSKLKQVRKSHGEEIDALLTRAAAIGDDSADWNAMTTLRREASTALRSLDSVDPRNRTALAKRLKETIARLTALGDAHDRDIETARQRLIEQAAALAERGDKTTLAREARELQKRWSALGNGRRSVDQRQWREFRAACDAAFGRLDAERKQHEEASAAAIAQVRELLAEFEDLAANETLPIDAVKARLRELDSRWQTLAPEDRTLQQRQRQAHDTIALRLRDAARHQRLARFAAAMKKYTFIRDLETMEPVQQMAWAEFDSSAPEFDLPLAARHDSAPAPAAEDSAAVRENLVRLEFLAGIESPAEDRQRRMNHQVQRLSSRMRGGAGSTSPERELSELLAAWFAQTPQAQALEDRFAQAATIAIDALP